MVFTTPWIISGIVAILLRRPEDQDDLGPPAPAAAVAWISDPKRRFPLGRRGGLANRTYRSLGSSTTSPGRAPTTPRAPAASAAATHPSMSAPARWVSRRRAALASAATAPA